MDTIGADPEANTLEAERDTLWAAIDRKAGDRDIAIVEMGPDGASRSITFAAFHADVNRVAGGLVELGVGTGDRIAMLIPPGIDLAVSIFAAWRIGAVAVLADAGLGIRGMGRALKSADPTYLIGIPRALSAARAMRWPGIRISTSPLSGAQQRMAGSVASLDDLRVHGDGIPLPPPPGPFDDAGVGFTSGSTGPAKGVTYKHHQLQAQRDALVRLYDIGASDSLVAAFGPFALLGTLMGIPSVVPDMKVTSPGSLSAAALADAAASIDATLIFASPAALSNVAVTAGELSSDQRGAFDHARLLLSAGAPVPSEVLRDVAALLPNAEAHTPYGMTEVMPVADISLTEIEAVGVGDGVCVGRPIDGVDVAISAIDDEGTAGGDLTTDAGILGEVCIRAPHMRDGYDKLWMTQSQASQPVGWHRSGDVGHLDDEGRLWIEGRIGHVITTANGPVTPVGIEHRVAVLDEVDLAAVVGVGPVGAQQVVVVLSLDDGVSRASLADEHLADRVREAAAPVDVAAVLVVSSMPVDKRHNSKIDRTRMAAWAEKVLTGGRVGRP
jgi:acyl-coenzyme A synthetase/AMP-(fatty) acid ligase